MDEHLIRLSKTISHALRHKPGDYGLVLDAEGWVAVDDLLAALRRRLGSRRSIGLAEIETIMAESEKQRFELRDDKIRAFYGHSTPTTIEREPVTPPALLYHGTTQEAAQAILREGLKSMKRQHVHLSTDLKTARIVGLRRTGKPVILRIAALEAHQHGIKFYPGNEDIWLADPIPPAFIRM
ncbi:MAG TPA: RNA 2'-phosphotransferase [Ktedonobacteraceae bacterium]